jgi:hypothetical protein
MDTHSFKHSQTADDQTKSTITLKI